MGEPEKGYMLKRRQRCGWMEASDFVGQRCFPWYVQKSLNSWNASQSVHAHVNMYVHVECVFVCACLCAYPYGICAHIFVHMVCMLVCACICMCECQYGICVCRILCMWHVFMFVHICVCECSFGVMCLCVYAYVCSNAHMICVSVSLCGMCMYACLICVLWS